jgi:hypothetical protein
MVLGGGAAGGELARFFEDAMQSAHVQSHETLI